jgi:hypothetical protein
VEGIIGADLRTVNQPTVVSPVHLATVRYFEISRANESKFSKATEQSYVRID